MLIDLKTKVCARKSVSLLENKGFGKGFQICLLSLTDITVSVEIAPTEDLVGWKTSVFKN